MSHQLRRLYKRPPNVGKPKRAGEAWGVERKRCGDKFCYGKAEAAYIAHRRSRLIDKRLRTYPCPICRYWHLTKRNPGKEKKADRDPKRVWRKEPVNPTRELIGIWKDK